MTRRPIRAGLLFAAALVALFAFRLYFGLSRGFFAEDESQIFLIGLRYYATGHWPYFGPDVVWTKSEIPGALQGVLVGWPLSIVPIPEAPIVLLNLLSLAALAALAWYITRRVPSVPRWLVWGWTMTVPWTLQFSTHINNPSYVLVGAIIFFIGFFEALPALRLGVLPLPAAFAAMGLGTTWIMQVHMSWYLLLPYLGIAWFSRRGDGLARLGLYVLACAAGAAVPGVMLLPTVLRYGAIGGSGGTLRNVHLHFVSPAEILVTLARVFSFSSLEINRFIEIDDARRVLFVRNHLWLLPLLVVVWAAGILQPLWMLASWFRSRLASADWRTLRWVVAITVGLVYVSYWFVIEPPQAHAFYVVAPISFLFAAYCWAAIDSPRWRTVAAVVLGANIAYHVAFATTQYSALSLYTNREAVVQAIVLKSPEMFGHRRSFAPDGGPPVLDDPTRPYNPLRDLKIEEPTFHVGFARTANWSFVLRNTNPRVAFRRIMYMTSYRDSSGRGEERHQFIERILQPNEALRFEVSDLFVSGAVASATIRIGGADALLPVRTAEPAATR
jgi:hypothetical protein